MGKLMLRHKLVLFFLWVGSSMPLVQGVAQNRLDSIQHLDEVVVTAQSYKEVIPSQKLSGRELEGLKSHSVADALRYFSGVQIKDYGGVGGIKTVNIRSMGTNHMGVFYDGIQLSNAQNGQVDLGQYSLDNIEEVSMYNGQKSEIFQSAKDFGAAGSIYLRTRVPKFTDGKTYNMRAALRAGSFGVINPSVLFENKLSECLSASFSAEWLNADGKYRFRYRRINTAGEIQYDTTAVRENGDINATRLEANLHGNYRVGNWYLKGYNYNSERGVPGAIVNNVWRRGERIWDTNSFLQGHWQLNETDLPLRTQLNWKYSFFRTHYVNNDDKQVKVDNLYKQREFYLSAANAYTLTRNWDVSLSYDFQWNKLDAEMIGFVWPVRYTHYLSLATAFQLGRLKVQGSGLATFVNDRIREQADPPRKRVFTPALYMSYTPFRTPDFSLRAFAKKSFRMPTFNDLYYADMGNSKLNPEHVTQYDFGLAYNTLFDNFFRELKLQADGYYNRVKDKIVAYPKGQQFRWTMLNLGKVEIKGVDLSAQTTVEPRQGLLLTLRAQYTYQQAIDITNPEDNYYRDQIPYIPWHSGSAIVNVNYRGWILNYSFIYVGERYNQQENIIYNHTQPWYTSDVSLSKGFTIWKTRFKATAEVNNLLSQDYDVILNYPMPKRNYRFGLTVEI